MRLGTSGVPVGPPSGPTTDQFGEQAGVLAAAVAVPTSARASLPAVLGDSPVAVLLIHRRTGQVTYANQAAITLAGAVGLPIDIDAWGAAVGLTDLGGVPLAGAVAPLSRVAGGSPVAGEPVRLRYRVVDGRAADDDAGGDRLLWVTGFPLGEGLAETRPPEHGAGSVPDGPSGTEHHHLSLVVFLPITEAQAAGAEGSGELGGLQQRAIAATDICFTITDPQRADNPLVWVNPAFTRVTGYSMEEAIGRNCRFLQGPATDAAAVAEIRAAVDERRPVTVTFLNYRADGSAFWNQLSVSPVVDRAGELVSFVGVQSDVTARVGVEAERVTALAAERAAREAVEAAHRQLQLMSEATSILTGTLDVPELIDRLAALCVPSLADWALVARLGAEDVVAEIATRGRGDQAAALDNLAARLASRPLAASAPAAGGARARAPVVTRDLSLGGPVVISPGRDVGAEIRALGGGSLVSVPMVVRGALLGLLVIGRSAPDGFDRTAVDLLTDLVGRAALALDNARLYQGQRSVAVALQRALLSALPEIPGIEAAAHYESALEAAAVGGDFYDLMSLPDGRIGITIGDVAGHDIDAAATMGQLRGLLRASAYDRTRADPAQVLDRVDELMDALSVPGLATVAHVHAERPTAEGGPWRLHVANAGHPPLALRTPDGAVRLLDGMHGLLLGVDASVVRSTTTVVVPAGSVLVGYTDGLVERHDEDLDRGFARLVERLAAQPLDSSAQELCSALIALADQPGDDVALIAVRLH